MCRPAYMSFPATLVAATAFLAVPANADPKLVNPEKYNIELFADLSSQEGAPKAFQLTIADGKRSLPAGLYVTTGPLSGTHSDRIFQIEAPDKINVFASGLESSETMLVADGKYGEGVLVSSPLLQQIMRVQPASGRFETAKFGTNKVSIFGTRNTSFGTKPFGVAVTQLWARGGPVCFRLGGWTDFEDRSGRKRGSLRDAPGQQGGRYGSQTGHVRARGSQCGRFHRFDFHHT